MADIKYKKGGAVIILDISAFKAVHLFTRRTYEIYHHAHQVWYIHFWCALRARLLSKKSCVFL